MAEDDRVDNPSRFSALARSSLRRAYSETEVQALEHNLARPVAALHVRVNLLRTTTEEARAQLAAHPILQGRFTITPHGHLPDVLVIPRELPHGDILPYIELDQDCQGTGAGAGAGRFAERRRRGLASHEVFVDRMCAEAVLKGANVYVAGVRGASQGLAEGHVVSVYADIHGALLRGATCDQKGLGGMRLLGTGVCCVERAALFRESSGLAIRMSHLVDGDLPALSGVLDGTIYAQTLPSLVAAHVLAAQPGERVLDMCGAPGSKTTHVATNFLRDAAGSLLVTCERNHGKLSRMARLCTETFGLSCVQPTRADTTKLEEAAEAGTEPSPPLSSSSHTAARGCENSVVGDTATALASASIAADDAWSHRRLQAEAVSQAAGGRTDHAAAHALARQVKLRRKEEQRARDKARWAAEQKAQEERARAALMATEEVHPPTAGKEGREGGCTAGDESQEGSNGRRGGGGANGLRGFATGSFDRVLLDPPCSALGLRPKLLQTSVPRGSSLFGSQAAYQRLFFWVAVRMLRVGGTLVYSTCTLTPEENEEQVAAALRRFPCLRLVPALPKLGHDGRPGLGLDDAQRRMVQRFEPALQGCEGFFIAKFTKVSGDDVHAIQVA